MAPDALPTFPACPPHTSRRLGDRCATTGSRYAEMLTDAGMTSSNTTSPYADPCSSGSRDAVPAVTTTTDLGLAALRAVFPIDRSDDAPGAPSDLSDGTINSSSTLRRRQDDLGDQEARGLRARCAAPMMDGRRSSATASSIALMPTPTSARRGRGHRSAVRGGERFTPNQTFDLINTT